MLALSLHLSLIVLSIGSFSSKEIDRVQLLESLRAYKPSQVTIADHVLHFQDSYTIFF